MSKNELEQSPIHRRHFLQRAGLAGVSLLVARAAVNRAVADPDPAPGSPVPTPSPDPEIYPFKLGGLDAYIIHDGMFSFPGVQPNFAAEGKKSEVDELLRRNFLATDHLTFSLNVLVLKLPAGIALFDSGAGSAFGPAGGRVVRGLSKLGIQRTDIKTVFLTHAHADHIAGLVDDQDQLLYPNAKVYTSKVEADFWTSPAPDVSGMTGPKQMRDGVLAGTKKYLTAVKSQLSLQAPGKLTSEVEMIAAPGHTPGHTIFNITVGGDQLLVIGDAFHVYALQFAHPEWTMAFDTQPSQAIATRRHIFAEASDKRQLLLSYHLPFPGLGHVRREGHGYEWVPKPWVA